MPCRASLRPSTQTVRTPPPSACRCVAIDATGYRIDPRHITKLDGSYQNPEQDVDGEAQDRLINSRGAKGTLKLDPCLGLRGHYPAAEQLQTWGQAFTMPMSVEDHGLELSVSRVALDLAHANIWSNIRVAAC